VGPHRYRILVSGRLGKFTREVFEDLCVEYDGSNTGLTGELDQAALYGVLNRFQAFGLELVALSRLDEEEARPDPPARCRQLRQLLAKALAKRPVATPRTCGTELERSQGCYRCDRHALRCATYPPGCEPRPRRWGNLKRNAQTSPGCLYPPAECITSG